jgi:hypothetical protein
MKNKNFYVSPERSSRCLLARLHCLRMGPITESASSTVM